jgi:hypothetical protein
LHIGINILEELAASIFGADDGDQRFLQNIGIHLSKYRASHPRRSLFYFIAISFQIRETLVPLSFAESVHGTKFNQSINQSII